MSHPFVRRFLLSIVGLGLVALPAAAQIPDEFTNLKVLPKDIGKQELIGIMRGWAGALGQRCNFCHPGPDNLRGMDFATDELEHKKIARQMAKMVGEINGKLLPASDSAEWRVTCVTCHHGLKKPATIQSVMFDAIATDGVGAALEKYAELREQYYGRDSYDFGSAPLNNVAETLAQEKGDVAGGIAVMQANVKYNPDESYPYILMGQLYASSGDMANAQKSLEKALEIEPDNGFAKRVLQQIKSSQEDG